MKTPPREDGALLAGVCSGIARAFGWNAWVLRGLFVLFLLGLPKGSLTGVVTDLFRSAKVELRPHRSRFGSSD